MKSDIVQVLTAVWVIVIKSVNAAKQLSHVATVSYEEIKMTSRR